MTMEMERAKDQYVIKYIVNNLMSTELNGQNRTAQHWPLVCELLHYGTHSTQSPLDLRSQIDTTSHNVENYFIGQLSGWVQVSRVHQVVMGSKAVLGEVVTKVTAAGFPISTMA